MTNIDKVLKYIKQSEYKFIIDCISISANSTFRYYLRNSANMLLIMKNDNTVILLNEENRHIPSIEIKLDELITSLKVEILLGKM